MSFCVSMETIFFLIDAIFDFTFPAHLQPPFLDEFSDFQRKSRRRRQGNILIRGHLQGSTVGKVNKLALATKVSLLRPVCC